ncbi:MAG: exonuclease SbcCD subunit D [Lachnospiraceae bacterium]|nr:exonuclease SbcCD subunit D [Lachnospiraceae bacterium]
MKFLHTSDLHIGKKIFECSLYDDQKHMLSEIHRIALEEKVDALVIAGDVYDRSMPPTEAVELLDDFLTGFVKEEIPVIMISGNHDSPERVSFGAKILEKQGLYIGGVYDGSLRRVSLPNGSKETVFVCLPFVKPGVVGMSNCQEAVAEILARENIDLQDGKQYVLITHYFVTGEKGQMPELSDSETAVDVGGIDNVTADVFQGFSYVALGHIHKSQKVGEGEIYYSGAPMKYSFSEASQTKSVNLVEIKEDGGVSVEKRALKPYREMRVIKGELKQLIQPEIVNTEGVRSDDYIQAVLTDRDALIDPIGTLRSVYPNMLQIVLEKNYSVNEEMYDSSFQGQQKSTQELFAEFYYMLVGESLTQTQAAAVDAAAREAGES